MVGNIPLLVKKLFLAFVVGFVGSLIPLLEGWSRAPVFHFDKAALIAALAGLVAAGVRAAIAVLPINIVPSDAQHTLRLPNHGSQSGQISALLVVLLVIILILAIGGGIVWSPWFFLILIVILLLFFFR